MGKTGLGGISAFFYVIIVITQLFQDVKDTGNRMLGHGGCGIIHHIHHWDPPFPAIFQIHIVIARGELADQL